uniref:Pyruvyl-transferase n=1 Tax=Acetithermum autotrophicum TaxID=1446466 RepID=H5SRP0_ACEAU|nr:pyruvyl-transferase [Candidatus Acetothermum autotrophicum]
MAPTLVIAGYYGFGNWGDEAALAVLTEHLRRAIPHARLIVLSHDPAQTVRLHSTDAVNRWNLLEIRRALARASGFILGPGSLLQDATSTRSLLYYLGLLRWAQRYDLPTYLIGQGIGPLRSGRSERWVAKRLQRARLVLVRDRASFRWAKAHNINVLLGEDLALLGEASAVGERGEGRNATLGLSLRPGLSQENLRVLRRALCTLIEKNFKLVFLPFHADQDLPVLNELALPASVVEAHSPHELLRAMRSVDVVLGMRLHSLVFALVCAVPFCALSYDPKIESFLRRVEELCECPLSWWSASGALHEHELISQILELYAQRDELRERLRRAQTPLQTAARDSLEKAMRTMASELSVF